MHITRTHRSASHIAPRPGVSAVDSAATFSPATCSPADQTTTAGQRGTIIETGSGIYQVDQEGKAFRVVHQFGPDSSELPIGEWQAFQRMSPVQIGERLSFFWLLGVAGRSARIGFLETSPVVRILNDERLSSEAATLNHERHAYVA